MTRNISFRLDMFGSGVQTPLQKNLPRQLGVQDRHGWVVERSSEIDDGFQT